MSAPKMNRARPHIAFWLMVQAVAVASLVSLLASSETGSQTRNLLMIGVLTVIALRMALTVLVLLPRPMPPAEALVVGVWLLIIYLIFCLLTLRNHEPPGVWAWIGIALFIEGSFINTFSEVQRMRFKRKPENRGRLYTSGLFSFATHINYTGDIEWAIGAALIAGHWVAGVIPVAMTAMFVLVHIPRLDAHLEAKYGEQFERYRASTARLFPWLY